MGFADKLERGILKFERVMMFLSILVMLVSVTLQVLFRYVIHASLPWTEEVSIISLVVMVFYGAIHAGYHDRHLGIRNLIDVLPERSYILVWFVKNVILILFLIVVMVVLALPMVREGLNQSYTITKLPLFYVFINIPIFGLLLAFHLAMSIRRKDYRKDLAKKAEG